MNSVIKDKLIQCANREEFQSITDKLKADARYAGVMWSCDTASQTINYKTEEITPAYEGYDRTKVLLLFKNPHPDSVAAGLFLSEPHSQVFWERLFEVDYNRNLLPLLNGSDWISNVAHALLSGKYNSPFLYYFRCLYPFPTKQFADLQKLFSGVPLTYKKEMLDRSIIELKDYIEQHGIQYIIVFFKDALTLPGCRPLPTSINAVAAAKQGIDQTLASGDESHFWKMNSAFRQETKDGRRIYLNMNTRSKNHGTHLPKRYFTYNLEFILRDILAGKK